MAKKQDKERKKSIGIFIKSPDGCLFFVYPVQSYKVNNIKSFPSKYLTNQMF